MVVFFAAECPDILRFIAESHCIALCAEWTRRLLGIVRRVLPTFPQLAGAETRLRRRIDIYGRSYYFTSNTGGTGANKAIPVLDVLTGLLGGPTGGVAAGAHGGVTATQLNGIGNVTSGITTLLSNQTANSAGAPTVPKAYINYIFFDEQFKVAASGFSKVGSNNIVKPHTDLSNKIAPKNGYVYIYVSNESPVNSLSRSEAMRDVL